MRRGDSSLTWSGSRGRCWASADDNASGLGIMHARRTICHLLHSLRMGGAEVLAARLARRLVGSYRFVFACLDESGTLGDELRGESFPVEVLGRRPGIDGGCSRRLARFLARERVDV